MHDVFHAAAATERERVITVDAVLSGICEALDRAWTRHGGRVASPNAETKAAWHKTRRKSDKPAWLRAGPDTLDWFHESEPRLRFRSKGDGGGKRWSYRFEAEADDAWRGRFVTRGEAFSAGSRELAGAR